MYDLRTHKSAFRTFLAVALLVGLSAVMVYALALPCEKPAEPKSDEVSRPVTEAPLLDSAVGRACSYIYQGDFARADQLLAQNRDENALIEELKLITSEHKAIETKRAAEKILSYDKQIAELQKLSLDADVNEPNDLGEIFKVIGKANEFADKQQKEALLKDEFVQSIISRSLTKAAASEAEGKWIDSYTQSYFWLKMLDPNNKQYSDHAEELMEKSVIKAMLQDSPCQTSAERYDGIKKDMFTWAITVLQSRYIDMLSFREMAVNALNKCLLMADVLQFADLIESSNIKIDTDGIDAFTMGIRTFLVDVKQDPAGPGRDEFISVFEKTLTLNEATIKLPQEILIAHFAEASFKSLDPHTALIWSAQIKNFQKSINQEFTGIGIEISKEEGPLKVVSLLPGTPAYSSGLDAGDIIQSVDGETTEDMSIQCAVTKITGQAGTNVMLGVLHEGTKEPEDITITRARIIVPTIRGWQRTEKGKWRHMLDEDDRIGYIRITSFTPTTVDDFEKALRQLEKAGMKSLIIDLRNDPGGLLSAAVGIVDKFIDEGRIVSTHPRFNWPITEWAKKSKTHPSYPLVILINSSSASASEIVAGALGDVVHSRAIIVGERSYGKGSVQTILPSFRGNAQLKYTTAYYHLPSGKRVETRDAMKKQGRDDWGVAPHVTVKTRSDEAKKMFELRRSNDVLVRAGHDNNVSKVEKHTSQELLEADPQLVMATLIARTKLIEDKNRLLVKGVAGK